MWELLSTYIAGIFTGAYFCFCWALWREVEGPHS